MTKLIVQVLGNSDIQVDGEDGLKKLERLYFLNDFQEQALLNEKNFIQDLDRVSFPLVQKLYSNLSADADILFAFILTDQIRWIQNWNDTPEGWSSVITLDGIWWEKILLAWCQSQNIICYPIRLDVDPGIRNGAADWEGMAESVDPLLGKYIVFENNSIYFKPEEGDRILLEKIIVQHNSGTPALSGALYLWGIEQKLAGNNIDFVYISEQEIDCYTHPGKHWQWRLKVPQIRELLEIQDFSGAFKLLDLCHPRYQDLAESFSFLDRSVSLNLEGRNIEGRDSIIERISIALWSEKAFRDRSQWMHWYLRIAGALELALLLVVEKQGNGNYQWHGQELIFNNDTKDGKIGRCSINSIVTNLLTDGLFDFTNHSGKITNFQATPITPIVSPEWDKFKNCFYINNWKLGNNPQEKLGFITLRNKLYHSLMGDSIDRLLDIKTRELNNRVDDPAHPSQIAVNWLEYVVQLADLSNEVKNRSDQYRDRILQILTILQ